MLECCCRKLKKFPKIPTDGWLSQHELGFLFLYSLILDLTRPLVNHWSPLTHTSLCMVTSSPLSLTPLSVWSLAGLQQLNDSIFVPPAAIYSLFHGFSLIHTAVAPSLSLDQRHGTCSKTICVSRTFKLAVFVVHWRRVFLISTRHIERFLRRYAI